MLHIRSKFTFHWWSFRHLARSQVALIVFLSHVGSFVPADAATVGLTDRFDIDILVFSQIPWCWSFEYITTWLNRIVNTRIFCAMGSKLMTAEQSTFMIDLHQVGMMLRYTWQSFLFTLILRFFAICPLHSWCLFFVMIHLIFPVLCSESTLTVSLGNSFYLLSQRSALMLKAFAGMRLHDLYVC